MKRPDDWLGFIATMHMPWILNIAKDMDQKAKIF